MGTNKEIHRLFQILRLSKGHFKRFGLEVVIALSVDLSPSAPLFKFYSLKNSRVRYPDNY